MAFRCFTDILFVKMKRPFVLIHKNAGEKLPAFKFLHTHSKIARFIRTSRMVHFSLDVPIFFDRSGGDRGKHRASSDRERNQALGIFF